MGGLARLTINVLPKACRMAESLLLLESDFRFW
jgi:hypothetical protein